MVYKSPLRYPGGKTRACKQLYKLIPKDTKIVYSPFLGGGSFELYLCSMGYQVVAFDNFKPLVNFWEWLLKDTVKLHDSISKYVGKVDISMFNQFKLNIINSSNNSLSDAACFYIVNRCSFSGLTMSGGFSKESSTKRFTNSIVNRLLMFKNISNFKVTMVDFNESLNGVPEDAFIFCDPPYDIKSSLYGISGSMQKDFPHQQFYNKISKLSNKQLITYNNSDIIKERWGSYNISNINWKYGMNKSKDSKEIIIKNY